MQSAISIDFDTIVKMTKYIVIVYYSSELTTTSQTITVIYQTLSMDFTLYPSKHIYKNQFQSKIQNICVSTWL